MSETSPHVLGELSAYLDDRLPDADRRRVEAHLPGCDKCRQHSKELKALRKMLHQSPSLKPSESFYQGVLQKIDKPASPAAWSFWGMPMKALVSAGAVMICVFIVRETQKGSFSTGGEPVVNEEIDAQLRRTEAAKTKDAPALAAGAKKEAANLKQSDEDLARLKSAEKKAAGPEAAAAGAQRPEAGELQESSTRRLGSISQAQNNVAARGLGLTQAVSSPASSSLAKRSDSLDARAMEGAVAEDSIQYVAKASPSNAAAAPVSALQAAVSIPPSGPLPEWKGSNSGFDEFRTVVVRNSPEWQALWQQHTGFIQPPPPLPSVDFTRNMVVGVYMGQKPSGGFAVEILETRASGDALVVVYRETTPAPGTMQTMALTEPFHLRVVPQSSFPVQFKKK